MSSTEKQLSFYAEYLPNIRSVTLTLDTSPASSYGLGSNGSLLRVTNSSGNIYDVPLPARYNASGVGMRISQDSRDPTKTVIRVPGRPLTETTTSSALTGDEEPVIPWTASQLDHHVEVRCKECESIIVHRGAIRVWKDLPSEGWAEMMDLWHCHKPDEHHLHGEHERDRVSGKGYAAGSKLVAKSETGFVDPMSFLLKREDCIGLEVQPQESSDNGTKTSSLPPEILCKICRSILGHTDPLHEGIRLQKPFLALSIIPTSPETMDTSADSMTPSPLNPPKDQTSSPSPPPPPPHLPSRPLCFPTEKWLSAHLLSLIASTGVRKFLTRDGDVEIWVFSSGLTFTSSSSSPPSSQPKEGRSSAAIDAIKVFWRTLGPAERERLDGRRESADEGHDDGSESLGRASLVVEELRLSTRLERLLLESLSKSNGILPDGPVGGMGGKRFLEWEVGLLAKFGEGDI